MFSKVKLEHQGHIYEAGKKVGLKTEYKKYKTQRRCERNSVDSTHKIKR